MEKWLMTSFFWLKVAVVGSGYIPGSDFFYREFMGLDVYLEEDRVITVENTCHCCGHVTTQKIQKEYFHEKITHNLAKLAAACGLYEALWCPEENGIEIAAQMIPFLREGIRSLQEDAIELMLHEPDNGFGSYDYLLRFARMYLEACEKFPNSTVRVER